MGNYQAAEKMRCAYNNRARTSHPLTTDNAAVARSRAGMYGFLATIYNQQADSQMVRNLRKGEILTLLTSGCSDNFIPDIRHGLNEMAEFIQLSAVKPGKKVELLLAVDLTRLFRGVNPEYGPQPPYEGLYLNEGRDDQEVMQDVYRQYKNEGVTVGAASQNRPDYIGIELDFMRHLSELEASAMDAGDKDRASEYSKTADAFLAEHLGQWCGKFCDLAIPYAKIGFYRGALQLTKGIVSQGIELR